MTTLTASTAKLVCRFASVPIPEQAIYRSKLAVLDCVGVALAGSREPVSGLVRDLVLETSRGGESTVWGTAHKVPLLEAALVNGTMSHALDYDDMNRPMLGHPSAVLVPALFALGEKIKAPARELLKGYVLGLEAMARIGRIFGPQAYDRSWHPTAVLGVLGVCASSSYLLRLGYEATLNAIGIAASEASGLKKNFGSMTKSLHAGSAARKGLWAALLAARGVTAGPDALDGRFGFMQMFDGEAHDLARESEIAGPLEILKSGLVYKQYPCCGGLHSVLDNALLLMQKEPIAPERVADVECRVNPQKVAYLDRPSVHEGLEAKFSIQYCVAAALLHGKVGLSQFADDNVRRADVQALMRKVRVVPGVDLDGFASEVSVRSDDGRTCSSSLPEPRGSASSPLTEDELLGKFIDCATVSMSPARAREAAAALMALDTTGEIGDVLPLLVAD